MRHRDSRGQPPSRHMPAMLASTATKGTCEIRQVGGSYSCGDRGQHHRGHFCPTEMSTLGTMFCGLNTMVVWYRLTLADSSWVEAQLMLPPPVDR